MNIQKMMAQAQAMQTKMQEELAAMRIEATAGGEMVKITMSGTKDVLAVQIDKAAVDPEDVETLQDLILAASREASRRVDEAVQKKTASMLGGMLPPGMR
jgi:DNA-binding YbaB/EbfC family protein